MSDGIYCDICRGKGYVIGEEDRVRCFECKGSGEYREPEKTCRHQGLYNSTPGCEGRVVPASGGGVKCVKCRGWFCY